jgi:hypothetical protein
VPAEPVQEQLVEAVSRNDKQTFEHVIIPTDRKNVFVVVIVDVRRRGIKGHYFLDLNKEYGL